MMPHGWALRLQSIPFGLDKDGRLILKEIPDGSRLLPSLQFWDIVKRNLDSVGTRESKDWARVLREHADELLPSYKTARAGAAHFFGAENALEAGQNFVGASERYGLPAAAKALSKMSPTERQLFQDGYVSRLVEKIEKLLTGVASLIRSRGPRQRRRNCASPSVLTKPASLKRECGSKASWIWRARPCMAIPGPRGAYSISVWAQVARA